jgi:RNA polymerase sigma-70 factor (ECF subfamily)
VSRTAGSATVYSAIVAEDSDAELVHAAQRGDAEAFTELVRRHERRVYNVCRRMLADAREAEECAQDAFVQAWRHLDRFAERAQLSTWLHRIAVNEALQRLRRRKVIEVDLDDHIAVLDLMRRVDDWSTRPDVQAEDAAFRAYLDERLMGLPDPLRVAVVLRDIEGLSNQEVAHALELSLPAAKARIHRGRMQLRAELTTWVDAQ